MPKRWVIFPLMAVLVMLFFTVFGERGLLHIHHLKQEQDELNRRLADTQRENERLKREIEALRGDRQYLETMARREFGLIKPNEVIYRFMTSAQRGLPPSPQAGAPQKSGQVAPKN